MNKLIAILIIVTLATGIVSFSSITNQSADAGSTKKVHFTQTVESSSDLGQGYEDRQFVLILSPNNGTLYDGSITFAASEPVQLVVLHEIASPEARGQPTWSVDGNTIYGMSLIDPPKISASMDFTGAAIGLSSSSPDEFVATVSVDGWIRGQPTEVIMQKIEYEKEEPSSLLSRASVPVTIPMHKAVYEGDEILYIITDGSDKEYSEFLSEKQGWNVEHAPLLADVPETALQQLYIFKNGVEGDGILGYQEEVFSATPDQESEYSALSSLIEVTWKPGQQETVLETAEEVLEAEEARRIEFNETEMILNAPQIVWPEGQMSVRSDDAISDYTPYDGGQITEINHDEMTVTFVAHRGWGPDGRTVYCIVTDATPSGPAQTMGVVSSPTLANLIASTATADLVQFKNGIKGSGQLGFQPGIASVSLGDENYTPMWKIHLAEWHDADSARILETTSDIDFFKEANMVSVSPARPTNSDHIINCPFIDPFQ